MTAHPFVYVVQHFPCETLGTIGDALEGVGVAHEYVRVFQEDGVPKDIGKAAGLVVMGGPMGVYEEDRYPHLGDERRLIEAALRAEKPVLGVCLGSQLLASVLGAPVTPGRQKELGWHPVTLLPSAAEDALLANVGSPFTAFHWHGDVFPLPAGGVNLASSAQTAVQAFRYGPSAYGFLFHMEVKAAMVAEMVDSFAEEAVTAGADPTAIADAAAHLPGLAELGTTVFRRWAALVRDPA